MVDLGAVHGKILRVNLNNKEIKVEEVPEEIYLNFLGGRGAGAKYLYDEVGAEVDPLSPENKLIFFNGPMIGTMAPGSNKIAVNFKSPATNGYSTSLCGGFFGPELKFAGYDGLIIEGKAEKPVYLWIENDRVELRDASSYWGREIPFTIDTIKNELGFDEGIHVAAIGPAGENLNVMACITADRHREFGRGGAGAVMGSKNLKAVAVRGTKDVPCKNAVKVAKFTQSLYQKFKENPAARARRSYGTPEMVYGINHLGFWSTKNFTEGEFSGAEKLLGPAMREQVVVGDVSCYACPISCGKISCYNSERYGRILIEGPEFETIGLLGANCGVDDWEYILKATQICDYNGMDTMAAGVAVSLAMECFEKGIITKEDTDGIELKFGNGEALVAVLQKIVRREGIGDILAQGVKIAAEKFGAPELAVHSKGLPFATYDPRGCKGMAITYATSPKGAHHMISPTMGAEIAGDRFAETGKGKLVRDVQIQMALVDSLGFCSSMRFVLNVDIQLELLNIALGTELTKEQFLSIGERILNVERQYNVRCGMDRQDDTLPKRFLDEPMTAGLSKGQTINLDLLLDEFYQLMGWDKDGKPEADKLAELKIS
ncbi:MAG: aldehyde ferredoxin oxidoreductase family protein [Dehalobacterium sp.]